MFDSVTQYADKVDSAMMFIIGFSIFMLVGITLVMLFFIYKYHHTRHPNPKQTHGSLALEALWIVIPTIIVISMFWVAYVDYSELRGNDQYDEKIHVNVRNWEWYLNYDNGVQLKSNIIKDLQQERDDFYLPQGKRIKFVLAGDDPSLPADFIHSFYIPAFRIKEDIVPGRESFIYVTPEKLGTYTLTCTEYCGQWHSRMYANIHVIPAEDYYKWKADSSPEEEGEEVATEEASEETTEAAH